MDREFNLIKYQSTKLTKGFKRNLTWSVVAVALANSPIALGFENTDYGTNAGKEQTASAEDNTNIGENAGQEIYAGDRNTNLGKNAGQSITNNSDTVMVGYNAGALNTASDNIFIGSSSGESNTNNVDNVFIGARAGKLSTANNNVFIGTEAGPVNTTGTDNTFVGEESGVNNTTGSDNTFIGQHSGRYTSEGGKNTFLGSRAGHGSSSGLLTGSNNTAVGESAGFDLTKEATRNTFFGSAAGGDVGEGIANTMIGDGAGGATEHADYNTFIGAFAGSDNNRNNGTGNANRNTALGAFAGFDNREGEDNVWIGSFAGTASEPYNYSSDLDDELRSSSNLLFYPSEGPSGLTAISRTVVFGAFANASGDDSISIGFESVARATDNVTIGNYALNRSNDSVTIGNSIYSIGGQSVTIGAESSSNHTEAITIGYQATSHADNTVVIGNINTLNWDPSADAVTSLGNGKSCIFDENDTKDWVCEDMYRFSDVASIKFSAIAADSEMVEIDLWADNGDDFADQWSLSAADDGSFAIASYVNSTSTNKTETRIKTDLFTLDNNGDATIAGNVTVNSDKRLKRSIQSIDGAVDKISKIKGVTYLWKEGLGRSVKKQYGLIAQNVEAVIPELVKQDKQGIKSVNYQGMVPVLISAVQELNKQSEHQQEQIALLKQQIKIQQALLAKLTKTE